MTDELPSIDLDDASRCRMLVSFAAPAAVCMSENRFRRGIRPEMDISSIAPKGDEWWWWSITGNCCCVLETLTQAHGIPAPLKDEYGTTLAAAAAALPRLSLISAANPELLLLGGLAGVEYSDGGMYSTCTCAQVIMIP